MIWRGEDFFLYFKLGRRARFLTVGIGIGFQRWRVVLDRLVCSCHQGRRQTWGFSKMISSQFGTV